MIDSCADGGRRRPQRTGATGTGTGARKRRGRAALQIKTARDRTVVDLLLYHKTRKLLAYWVPFTAVVLPLGLWHVTAWRQPLAGVPFGIFVYSLIEYASHRFLYHTEPEGDLVRTITGDVARQHLKHHKEPGKYSGAINGNQRPIIVFASLVVGLAFLLPLPLGFSLLAVAAGGVNYAAQELIHFGTHFLPMRGRLLSAVKRHHMLHHYHDDGTNFGLFWTVWDAPFGTDFHRRHRANRDAAAPLPAAAD